MKIHERFELGVPIQRMYDAVNDIDDIGWCVAGVKQVKEVSADD